MSHLYKLVLVLVLVGLVLSLTACDASKEEGWTNSCIRELKEADPNHAEPSKEAVKACVDGKREAAERLAEALGKGKEKVEELVATPTPTP